MRSPEIIVYSKPNCCLCDKVKEQLKKLQQLHDFSWREINILDHEADFKRFQYEIPVVFVDGRKVFKYHLDEKRFVRLLESTGHKHPDEASSAP